MFINKYICHALFNSQSALRILEVVDLYKALCRLESHPQIVKSIEVNTKRLALQSHHTEAVSFLCQVENVEVGRCFFL